MSLHGTLQVPALDRRARGGTGGLEFLSSWARSVVTASGLTPSEKRSARNYTGRVSPKSSSYWRSRWRASLRRCRPGSKEDCRGGLVVVVLVAPAAARGVRPELRQELYQRLEARFRPLEQGGFQRLEALEGGGLQLPVLRSPWPRSPS